MYLLFDVLWLTRPPCPVRKCRLMTLKEIKQTLRHITIRLRLLAIPQDGQLNFVFACDNPAPDEATVSSMTMIPQNARGESALSAAAAP